MRFRRETKSLAKRIYIAYGTVQGLQDIQGMLQIPTILVP